MPRKLPEIHVLVEHVQQGWDNERIARHYGASREAVRQQLAKAGVMRAPQRASHGHYIPWRVRADHAGHYCAKRLRAYSKKQQGWPLGAAEEKLLQEFLDYMDGDNPVGVPLSVHYSRDDGFWVEPRRPGDRDYITPPASAEASAA